MNKKMVLLGSSLALGSALIVTSAFAGIGDAPGYDAYKAAIKNTASAQSMTEKVAVSVQDNGAELLHIDSAAKTDKASRGASANVTVKSGTADESLSVYRQDGKVILKSSDSEIYNVLSSGEANKNKHKGDGGQADAAMKAEMEHVVDAVVGNLKNYVTLSPQSDGTQAIDVALSGSQIPAAANAIASFAIKAAAHHNDADQKPGSVLGSELQRVKDSLPKLTQDVQINEVDLHAVVNAQNQITDQTFRIALSGKDDSGAAHQVVIQADIGLSDFNSTTPDTVDLTGKQVQTIEKKRGHNKE